MPMAVSVLNIVLNGFVNDSRVLKESLSLKKAGYDVRVIALYEHGLPRHESVNGIPVERLRLRCREISKSIFMKPFTYLELLIRLASRCGKADILHCNDLDLLPLGVFIKRFINRKAALVYDAHEYETEKTGQSKAARPFLRIIEGRCVRRADAVLTVSGPIAEAYARSYAIPEPALVLNCPPFYRGDEKRNDIFRNKFNIPKKTRIYLYQGGLSPGRGIEVLLEVFREMKGERAVVFLGYGPLQDIIKESAESSERIFFHEAVGSDILLNYTSAADAGFSFVENVSLSYYYSLPNKLFEYIMAGIPVVASNLVEMRRIVEKYGIGTISSGESAEDVIRAMDKLEEMDSDSLRKNLMKASSLYNWENQEKVLLDVYRSLPVRSMDE